MSDHKKTIVWVALAGGVVAALLFGAAAWFVMTSGDIEDAGGDLSEVAREVTEEAAAEAPEGNEGPYEPTSRWIEEGVDPDVTQLGFGGEKAKKPTRESDPTAAGGISEYEIQNIINRKQNSLMECYADALQRNPDLQGRVDMRFGIAPDGHLSLVEVTGSSLESKQTEDCLVERARAWKFPQTGRSTLMKFDTDFNFVYE